MMMNRLLVAAALAALPLAAVEAQAPTTAASYVKMAGAGDQYEIQSSRVLLQSTQNAQLREFANTMIAHHTKSTADVKAAAQSAKVAVPAPRLDAKGLRDVAALRVARGTTRDQLYVTQQKAAHQKALALHQGYAANGDTPALKTVADQIAPVVQQHIDMLAGM
jgi:putative membrane protein